MIQQHGLYQIDDSRDRVDFPRLTTWLNGTYWAQGRSQEIVERSARYSAVVIGAYVSNDGGQVGFARVVSDCTTFAWIADVYVDEAHRRKGLALALVRFALAHPELQPVNKWFLATRDAQDVYLKAGFKVVDRPQNLMWIGPGALSMYEPPLKSPNA
jgi:GNAT superfamily N-acetyltransferase